jgi:hypothetical protein
VEVEESDSGSGSRSGSDFVMNESTDIDVGILRDSGFYFQDDVILLRLSNVYHVKYCFLRSER